MSRRTPSSGRPRSDSAQAAAVASLEHYLAGFGLAEGAYRTRLVRRFLRRALVWQKEQPRADLASLAPQAAEQALSDWFARILDPDLVADHPPVLIGRAAYWSCDGPSRWPDALLHDAPPAALVEAMRQAAPAPVPPGEPGSMPAQPLESWSVRGLAGAIGAGLRDAALALARRAATSRSFARN